MQSLVVCESQLINLGLIKYVLWRCYALWRIFIWFNQNVIVRIPRHWSRTFILLHQLIHFLCKPILLDLWPLKVPALPLQSPLKIGDLVLLPLNQDQKEFLRKLFDSWVILHMLQPDHLLKMLRFIFRVWHFYYFWVFRQIGDALLPKFISIVWIVDFNVFANLWKSG